MSLLIIMTVRIPCDAYLSVQLHAAAPSPFAITICALTSVAGSGLEKPNDLLQAAKPSRDCRPITGSPMP